MTEDRLEKRIYYVQDSGLFLTIDRQAKAQAGDWVVVERQEDGDLVIEPFDDQFHSGICVVLGFYRLRHGEQWTPFSRELIN